MYRISPDLDLLLVDLASLAESLHSRSNIELKSSIDIGFSPTIAYSERPEVRVAGTPPRQIIHQLTSGIRRSVRNKPGKFQLES